MSFSYGTMWPVYAKQWDAMEAIDDEWARDVQGLGEHAISNKARYQGVERDTGVPWMMIAAIHRRESDCDFDTYLGNGEPLNEVTELVPAGRGPFDSWEEGAIDALDLRRADRGHRLAAGENAVSPREVQRHSATTTKGSPSPYLWAGTTIQEPGKYVADGKFGTPMPWTSSQDAVACSMRSTGWIRRRSTSARRR